MQSGNQSSMTWEDCSTLQSSWDNQLKIDESCKLQRCICHFNFQKPCKQANVHPFIQGTCSNAERLQCWPEEGLDFITCRNTQNEIATLIEEAEQPSTQDYLTQVRLFPREHLQPKKALYSHRWTSQHFKSTRTGAKRACLSLGHKGQLQCGLFLHWSGWVAAKIAPGVDEVGKWPDVRSFGKLQQKGSNKTPLFRIFSWANVRKFQYLQPNYNNLAAPGEPTRRRDKHVDEIWVYFYMLYKCTY